MGVPTLSGLSLCTGAYGLEQGLHMAFGDAYRTVCGVEWETAATSLLVARMQDGSIPQFPLWDDVKSFDGKPWRGVVDILSAGYPCQPFSVAGQQRGAVDPRHLWPDVFRIVGEVRPRLCVFENVRGHVRLGLREVRRDLLSLGYEVHAGIFSAAEVGAPHRRERLFILAHRSGARFSGRENAGADGGDADADRGRSGQSERSSQPMADASNGLIPQPGRRPQGRDGAGSGGAQLGDANTGDDDGRGRTGARRWAEPANTNSGMGDTDEPRLEGRHGAIGERAYELPAWPPGPAEHERWAAILAERPDLAPAVEPGIRRVADGMADWVDLTRAARLRLTGNGVVPQCAAFAVRALMAEAGLACLLA